MELSELLEMVARNVVWRDGKRLIKKQTDRVGYKMQDGQEVKMTTREQIKRRKAGKRTARKNKSKEQMIIRKRERTMKKRGDR
jgi:hypothetical protein